MIARAKLKVVAFFACPTCGAGRGTRCRSKRTGCLMDPHVERSKLYAESRLAVLT